MQNINLIVKRVIIVTVTLINLSLFGIDSDIYEELDIKADELSFKWDYEGLMKLKDDITVSLDNKSFEYNFLRAKIGMSLIYIDNKQTGMQTNKDLYGETGFLKKAVESAEAARKIKPDDMEIIFYLSYLYNMSVTRTNVGPASDADRYKMLLGKLDPENYYSQKINLFYYLARGEGYGGNKKMGMKLYEEFIEKHPEDTFAMVLYASTYLSEMKFDETEKVINKVLELNPYHSGAILKKDLIDVYRNNPTVSAINFVERGGVNHLILDKMVSFHVGDKLSYEKLLQVKKRFNDSTMADDIIFIFEYDRIKNKVIVNIRVITDGGSGYRMIYLQAGYIPSINFTSGYKFTFSHISPPLFMYDDTNVAGIGLGITFLTLSGFYYYCDLKYNLLDYMNFACIIDLMPAPLASYIENSRRNSASTSISWINSTFKIGKRFPFKFNVFGRFSIYKNNYSHESSVIYLNDNDQPEYIAPSNDSARSSIGFIADYTNFKYSQNGWFKQGWKSELFFDYYIPIAFKDWGFADNLNKISYSTFNWGISIGTYWIFADRINFQFDIHYRDAFSPDDFTRYAVGKNQPNTFNSDGLRVRGFDLGQFSVTRLFIANSNINIITVPKHLFIGMDVDNAFIYDDKNLSGNWHYLLGGSAFIKALIPKAEMGIHFELGYGMDIDINRGIVSYGNLQIAFYISKFCFLPF